MFSLGTVFCIWGFLGSSVGKESTCNARDPGLIPAVRKVCWRRDRLPTPVFLGFPCGLAVKNMPAMRETWVQSPCWEGPLEKGTATHSSILAWRIQSMKFSRGLLNPGIEPRSPTLQAESLPAEPQGKTQADYKFPIRSPSISYS